MSIEKWVADLKRGDRTTLARLITLLESTRAEDMATAKVLLNHFKKPTKDTLRIGISGPPGVGKSTLIEKLGLKLIANKHRVAVLAVDPSSEKSGGSILGDKTRMEELSRAEAAFIRPSPHRGHLGGVTSSLPGVILLCEAAGYDRILIESVGVGQSEVELSKMVDVFTFVTQAGGGDELQGIKKGILEYVDLILVNKSDRDSALVATSCQQYLAALKIVRSQATVPVLPCSALTGEGFEPIVSFLSSQDSHSIEERRKEFFLSWFDSLLAEEFRRHLKQNSSWQTKLGELNQKIKDQATTPVEAVDVFFKQIMKL